MNKTKQPSKRIMNKLFFLLLISTLSVLVACSSDISSTSENSKTSVKNSNDTNGITYLKLGEMYEVGNESYGVFLNEDQGSYRHRTDQGSVTYIVHNGYVQEIRFYPKELWYREISSGDQPAEYYMSSILEYEPKEVTDEELRELAMTTDEYVEKKFHTQKEWFIPTDSGLIKEGDTEYASRPLGFEVYTSDSLPKGENTSFEYFNSRSPHPDSNAEATDLSPTEFVVEVPKSFPEFEYNHFSVHMNTRYYNGITE